ncbi:MAG TPA: MFS transporter [Candidatus Acidoferrales bacterium]|nr:MFS transporter [Candidatus Acidoferrales bacterium]
MEIGPQSSPERWFILGIVTLAQVGVAIIHLGIPALVPFIQQDLHLSRTEVGLISSVLNGAVVVAAIAAGKAVDHLGERWVIAAGAIVSGLAMMAILQVGSFGGLLFLLIFVGFATASCTPAGSKAVAIWFPATERGTAMSVRQTSVPLGGALAAMTLPSLALARGWRFALFAAGIVALVIGAAVLGLYREPPASRHAAARAVGSRLIDLVRRKDIWAGLAYAFTLSGSQWCFLTYTELYLTEALAMPITLAAALLAAGQVSGTIGRVIWGVLSDRLCYGRRKPVLIWVALLGLASMIAAAFFSPATPLWFICLIVGLLGASVMSWNGIYLTMASELAGLSVAGLAIGLSSTFAFLGIVVFPPIFGYLVDAGFSYRFAWIALGSTILVPVALLRWVREDK